MRPQQVGEMPPPLALLLQMEGQGTPVLPEPAPQRGGIVEWKKKRGYQLVRFRDHDYRLKKICEFVAPDGGQFGHLKISIITTGHTRGFRHARRLSGISPVTINHDLKLLRKMFNCGVRERLIERTRSSSPRATDPQKQTFCHRRG